MKKATKIILGSALTMALSASLIAGSTLALFSSESKVDVAITSGEVSVKATVGSIKGLSAQWGTEDYTETQISTDATSGSFTTGGKFEYNAETGKLTLTNIAPGDGVEFDLNIENSSTIAIKYRAQITASEDGVEENKIYEVLKVTFGSEAETTIGPGGTISQNTWTNLDANAKETTPIHVKIVFPIDGTDQNKYQKQSCSLSISVYAVQQNGHVD